MAAEQKLEQYFNMFDVDGNNQIALSELKDLWYVLYNVEFKNDADASKFMAQYDHDDDKTISLDEFKKLIGNKPLDQESKQLIEMFIQIDTDHNKYISRDEIKEILKDSPKAVEKFMNDGDKDNDGKVSLKEFCLICRKNNFPPSE